jgi:Putative heavy-metal-binding
MGFFARSDDSDDGGEREELARIEGGGIPSSAEERLKALGADGAMFTSGLSVNEFALLHRLGPQPLAQVMGASVVRVGWQYLPPLNPNDNYFVNRPWVGVNVSAYQAAQRYTEPSWTQIRNYKWHTEVMCTLDVLTDAWNTARRRALDRLYEEALQVGADAVVGVHLSRSDHDLGKGLIEYVVTGTAIRFPNSSGTMAPLLTDVSAQEFWKLHIAGYEPVGLVASTAVMFASPQRTTRIQRARRPSRNRELDELSQAFHTARDNVRSALRDQTSYAHGTDAVGVAFEHTVHREKFGLAATLQTRDMRGWHRGRLGIPYRVSGRGDAERRGWVITMHAAGTAIRRRTAPAPFEVKTSIRMGAK